ncbi:efflux RND transporter periplasmic adaptor subunit [Ramlibacter henchirensis]|uniref:Efflux RND transporter periplasmic adaptor subunit n=1 Tax=Ramlibacter henchirensis TaxID=204072 RepID=A0A4Z0C332_9BURK|nr:efflux RND transporter periplasmic adaptor subunit [Ramlibacter henchirensis]TFZ05933.1 efflux RND transporter periplasmic adaptor subunit [Ramlibacter henchirensis]
MKTIPATALLGITLLIAGCGADQPPPVEEVRPVRTSVAGTADGSVGATYSGSIHARYESRLGFEASGRIAARLVEVGAHVRRGQPLMRLDPAQETLHMASAMAEVESARSRVAQDQIDLQRTEQLLARSFASQAELDQQKLKLAESQARLKSATAQHQIKANQRAYTELRADRDGVVSAISAEAGQVVSAGQQVVTIAGDGEREVLVSIPESRVEELRSSKSLQVNLWALPGKQYTGRVRELSPDADSVTRTYSARIRIEKPDPSLLLGMTASVVNPDVGGASAIRLPLSAIYDRDGTPRVWLVDPKTSTVSLREVKLGRAQDDSVLINSGLAGGETIVTAGAHLLHAGQKVRPLSAPAVAQRQP